MKKQIFFLLLSNLLISCEENTPRSNIPYAPVSFTLQLNSYDNILNNPLTFKVFTEKNQRLPNDRFGYSGLLVVTNASGDAIYAYDLCCPYEADKSVKIIPRSDGRSECKNCGSVFITIYGTRINGQGMMGLGSAESGPAATARLSLRSYRVTPVQYSEFRIIN